MARALVIGKGESGKSAKRLLEQKGYDVVFENTSMTIPKGPFAFAVLSPGIDKNDSYVQAIREKTEVISEVELAFRNSNCKIIAVTGTNGKSSLVTYLGCLFGSKVCGNIGIPACDVLPNAKESETVIIELSSFQLEFLFSKRIDVAILLKVTPDHLDRHKDFSEYKSAKLHIKDLLVNGGEFFMEEDGDFDDGRHFLGPVMQIVKKLEARAPFSIKRADELFIPLEHRLEFVVSNNGVTVVNDSKSTTPESTVYALKKTPGSIVLLVGGKDKNSDFSLLEKAHDKRIKAIVCFGSAREKIKKSLQSNSHVYTVEKMDHAILKGLSLVSKGDTLLFSPGCTSYDEFANFGQRGREFKKKILELRG